MPRQYSPQFRERVLALVLDGRDAGELAAELADARRRIRELQLEEELSATRLAATILKDEGVRPKRRFPVVTALTGQGISIATACRVLRVTDRGYRAWRDRPMS